MNDIFLETLGVSKSQLVELFKKQVWDFDPEGDEVYYVYDMSKQGGVISIQNHNLDDELMRDIKFDITVEIHYDIPSQNGHTIGFCVTHVAVTDAYSSEVIIEDFAEITYFLQNKLFDGIMSIIRESIEYLN